MRRLAVAAATLAAFTAGLFLPGPEMDDTLPPPCPREDSRGPCHWDATARGNGESCEREFADKGADYVERCRGTSFVIDADQRVTYLP